MVVSLSLRQITITTIKLSKIIIFFLFICVCFLESIVELSKKKKKKNNKFFFKFKYVCSVCRKIFKLFNGNNPFWREKILEYLMMD